MIRRLDLRNKNLSKADINLQIPRAKFDINQALTAIAPILEKVRTGNESDLIAFGAKFDGAAPQSIRVPKAEL